jgi:hypothetical protein
MTNISSIIKAGITAGKSNEDILKDVYAAFPAANTKAASVSWYRSQMKKAGTTPPPAKKTATAKAVSPETKPTEGDKAIARMIAHDFVHGKGFVPKAENNPHPYEVRNIKSQMGQEGPGFRLDLYRDGKKVAHADDWGTGGPVDWEWFDKDSPPATVPLEYGEGSRPATQEEAMFDVYCRHQPKYDLMGDGKLTEMTPDVWISEALNRVDVLKQWKRMSKKVATVEDGNIYTYKREPTPENIASIKAKKPGIIVLNELSDEEAVAHLLKLQG